MLPQAEAPPGATRFERSKAARRARIIAAVLDIAREGGYEAVQIRPVSERSGVASDTIYRYFGSRHALISAALIDWMDREVFPVAPSWNEGDTAAEKLLAALRHSWEVWERNPKMLETFLRAALTDGHRKEGHVAHAREQMTPLLADSLRGVDAEFRDDVMMLLAHFTHSAMSSVVQNQLAIRDVFPLLDRIVKRLAQHPAMAKHRPAGWTWVPT